MNLFTEILKESNASPIIWSIAGSDSSGGAGVQADLKTYTVLGSHGACVLTAITAQNTQGVLEIQPVGDTIFSSQLCALSEDLIPRAIKIGMISSAEQAKKIVTYLSRYPHCFRVYDPVRGSTTGTGFFSKQELEIIIKEFLPHLDLITPNLLEAEEWLNYKIETTEDIENAGKHFCELGARAVLIKGGHFNSDFCMDFFTDGDEKFWITTARIPQEEVHGTGCSFSSAIAHFCAQDYDLKDAIVLAKTWQQQTIRYAQKLGKGQSFLKFNLPQAFKIASPDFPWVTKDPFDPLKRPKFPDCGEEFGLYTVVPDLRWLKRHLEVGVRTIQLRIKNPVGANPCVRPSRGANLRKTIQEAVRLAKEKGCRLFINDHWQEAIEAKAYGVHLGQGDLDKLDPKFLEKGGLRLGVSTHSYFEAARAHYYRPSYVALGPIFKTESHPVSFSPQGTRGLKIWKKLFDYPLVAIGGIHLLHAQEILAEKVHGVCVMSEMLEEECVQTRFLKWRELFQKRNSLNLFSAEPSGNGLFFIKSKIFRKKSL